MFHDFSELGYLSTYLLLGTLFTILNTLFFFFRLWIFYKKGNVYIKTNEKLPKFSDIQFIFLAIGLFGTIFIGLIPFGGYIISIATYLIFYKISPGIIHTLSNPAKIKPEKMLFIGVALGFAGIIGFLLGFYRASNFKDEEERAVTSDQKG